jgi:diacylglycerol O-acyltransferase / wax synthase
MSAIGERLTSLDTTFLELEQSDESSSMHIGAALVFDPPDHGGVPSVEEVCVLLEERFGMLPSFRWRLSDPRPHGLRRPMWVDDRSFDVRAHVRHATLPAPGGEVEMDDWLADFWTHRLDRTRPLWEMTIVDGLADGSWMLATKTHHAMVDGVGSMDIGHILLDAKPDPAAPGNVGPSNDLANEDGGIHLPVPDWVPIAVGAARGVVGTALHPRRIVKAGEAAVAMGEFLWEDEIQAARGSSLNVPIGATRRFRSVGFELDRIKEIKAGLGGTVNDVVLGLASGALRRLLETRGEELERPLRAMVPVNLRIEEDGNLGNHVTSLFVELPIGETDRRMRYVHARANAVALKNGSAALGGETLVTAFGLLPPVLHESIARTLFAPRLFNLTITNVPGPQVPLYSLGTQLRRIIPLVPLFAEHAVGMAIVSYNGELVFGINADYAAVPDLDVLTEALQHEFAELLALARSRL